MLCQNHCDVMAFVISGQSALGCRQDKRKVGHSPQDVAVIKEGTPWVSNSGPKRREMAGAKCCRLTKEVRLRVLSG
jgi:hypothetical protein